MAQYAPTSGTDAMDFIGKWCGRCSGDCNDDCPVLTVGYSYGLGGGNPPPEWQYERGEPVCTAFMAIDPFDQPQMHSAACKDLFPAARRLPTIGEQVRMIASERTGGEG